MKKAFLVATLIFFSVSSFGQKIRFTDSTNVWEIYVIEENGSASGNYGYTRSYSGSTIINGKKCMILRDENVALSVEYVYEDTIANKVYIRISPDSIDYLLYDYNLTIGDTLTNIIHSGSHLTTVSSWVIALDSTQMNGTWYKVWHLKGKNVSGIETYYYYCVIEGIGCMNGLDFPVNRAFQSFYAIENFYKQTRCFSNDGMTYPLTNPAHISCGISTFAYIFDNTTSCNLAAEQINKKVGDAKGIPNPIDLSSKIVLPNEISSGSVVVFNDLGQTFVSLPFQNKGEILIGDKIKVPGIYYYRVMDDENGKVYSGKFVKQ